MKKDLKERLMRVSEIGQQLIDSGRGQELKDILENMGVDLRDLNADCEVCAGTGIHPVENPKGFDGDEPHQHCPSCFGIGKIDHFSPRNALKP